MSWAFGCTLTLAHRTQLETEKRHHWAPGEKGPEYQICASGDPNHFTMEVAQSLWHQFSFNTRALFK